MVGWLFRPSNHHHPLHNDDDDGSGIKAASTERENEKFHRNGGIDK